MGIARSSNLLGKITGILVICCCSLPAQAKYGGGSGTSDYPYLIYDANQMNEIGLQEEDWASHFKLMADIDLGEYTGTNYNIIGYYVDLDSPDNKSFTGVFDGNDHTISNFTYTSTNRNGIGLFGYVSGEIKNLGLIDPNVDAGTGSLVGSLVGDLTKGTITNCYAEGGSVLGDDDIGGLVGGGGHSFQSKIINCYSTCSIIGSSSVGGLVGVYNTGTIKNCYSTGDVSGHSVVGGLVGGGGHSFQGKIINCYSTGSVSGDSFTGGLLGMIGLGVKESFWDIETSGQESSSGGTGLPTAQMQDPNTFMDAGWDLVGESDGPSDVWAEPSGGGYPILWWQLSTLPPLPDFSGGTGEPNKPYLISTTTELNSIGHNPRLMAAHFKLINDIYSTGVNFFIIGSEIFPFSGVFDGNDHTISNFTYDSNDRDYIGLFGYVSGDNALIKDMGLIDPNLDAGTGWMVGSLVGNLVEGTITNCYAEGGSVSGRNYLGGLVGWNSNGEILNCYATSNISGEWHVGGLVGLNEADITGCYATGSVSGGVIVGGLVGRNFRGTITNCYSKATVSGTAWNIGGLVGSNVGTVSNCFSSGNVTGNTYVSGLVAENEGTITNCQSTGSVTGGNYVGGLVGVNLRTINNCYSTASVVGENNYIAGLVGLNGGGTINNCFSSGNVTGNAYISGLVAENNGTIINCYSKSDVSGTMYVGGLVGRNSDTITNSYSTGTVVGDANVGGLVGENGYSRYSTSSNCYVGVITNSYWDIETSGEPNMCGSQLYCSSGCDPNYGKTTAEMQTNSTFTDAGWDFVGEIINGPNDIWDICEGTNYPKLSWQIPLGDFLCPDGVNFVDFSFFAEQWAEDNCAASNDCDGRDLDLLGSVDIKDLRIFVDNWMRGF